MKARFEILKVHAKKIKMSEGKHCLHDNQLYNDSLIFLAEVDLEIIARGTSGFSG